MKLFTPVESAHFLNLDFYIPASSNAFSLEAARELRALQKSYAKWKKPVVLTSRHPRLFCSGGNLSDYKKLKGKAPGLKVNREIQTVLDAFGNWPVVKLALIEGDVLGGGMEWLARFDFRWSAPQAVFAFWQKRIGLSTGWGGGKAWAAKLGEDRVRALLLEGRVLSAGEAFRRGLVDRIVPAWKIRRESESWAAKMGGAAVPALHRWTSAKEAQVFSSLWMGPEHLKVLQKWRS